MIHNLLIIARMLVLAFSLYGYMQKFNKKIQIEFIPMVLFSTIGCLIFISGILNILKLATSLIVLLGLIYGIQSIIKKENPRKLLSPGTIFFVFFSAIEILLLYGNKFTHYDNFSHWAIVARHLVQTDRFPNFQESYIMFQDYPLGSASFIYFIAKVTGLRGEWIYMYAQALLILSYVTGLFAIVKNNKIFNSILITITYIFILGCNISLYDLLVDTLLPLAGAGALLYCIYYKENIEYHLIPIVFLISYCITIKNSGFFFAAIIWTYCIFQIPKNKNGLKHIAEMIITPAFIFYLWNRHVKLVYIAGDITKHSMTIKNFKNVFGNKNSELINAIFSKLGKTVFSFNNKFLFCLVAIIFLLVVLAIFERSLLKKTGSHLSYLVLIYLIYQVGMLSMYLFSMPNEEASYLAGYDRYHKSILIFIVYMLCVELIYINNSIGAGIRSKYAMQVISTIMVLNFFLTLSPSIDLYKKQNLENSIREKYDNLVSNYAIPKNSSYIVVIKDWNPGYVYFLSRYLLYSTEINVITEKDLNNLDGKLYDYEYLILLDTSEITTDYINQKFNLSDDIKVIYLPNFLPKSQINNL